MLRTDRLTKAFGDTIAVQDLSLHVLAGEIYGFLGPNGAGKTTTIRLLLGLLPPTDGNIFLFDRPVSAADISLKRRIGVVVEDSLAAPRMTAWEFVRFFADLNDISHPQPHMEHLFRALNLWDVRDLLVSAYSRGMRQKLSLIRALVHRPDLLILDEPVSGLDPYGIREVRQVVEEHRQNGGAVLISSHILSEIERAADRVGILHKGHLLVEDTIDGIRHRLGASRVVQLHLLAVPADLPSAIERIAGVEKVEQRDQQLHVHLTGTQESRPALFQAVVDHHGVLTEMSTEQMSLEEAFVTITNQNVKQLAGTG